ncbi:MAG: hypothetical protein LBK42_06665 [Propionibacteriaceae bacterium]|jgi:hypothetical protein|nr:hypothetical protein [Propionibacteriaceae bacterium]
MFDYGADVLWLYDEDGGLIDNCAPPELSDYPDIVSDLRLIEEIYASLFLNTPHTFEWVGFKSGVERAEFVALVRGTIAKIRAAVGDRYLIEDDSELDQL